MVVRLISLAWRRRSCTLLTFRSGKAAIHPNNFVQIVWWPYMRGVRLDGADLSCATVEQSQLELDEACGVL
jgi:hypothetical protein